jgi:hypothetical protein
MISSMLLCLQTDEALVETVKEIEQSRLNALLLGATAWPKSLPNREHYRLDVPLVMLANGNEAPKNFANPRNTEKKRFATGITKRQTTRDQIERQREVFRSGLDHGKGYFVGAATIFGGRMKMTDEYVQGLHPIWKEELEVFEKEWKAFKAAAIDDADKDIAEFVLTNVVGHRLLLVDGNSR